MTKPLRIPGEFPVHPSKDWLTGTIRFCLAVESCYNYFQRKAFNLKCLLCVCYATEDSFIKTVWGAKLFTTLIEKRDNIVSIKRLKPV